MKIDNRPESMAFHMPDWADDNPDLMETNRPACLADSCLKWMTFRKPDIIEALNNQRD